MAIEEFIARKINPDGSTGTSKATIENHVVTYENSETPSPYITEIKTLNGVSLVGSGNYDFDTALNETSTNAVQNNVVAKFANDVAGTYVTKIELYEALKRGEVSSEVEKVYTSEINYIAENVMPSGKVTKILGKTEKSENLIVLPNESASVRAGVTRFVLNGVISYSGTPNTQYAVIYRYTSFTLSAGTYYFIDFGSTNIENYSKFCRLRTYDENSNLTEIRSGNAFTVTGNETLFELLFQVDDYQDTQISGTCRPMIVAGSTAPTTWSQGYNGLKHTHISGLKTTGINLWDEEWESGSISIETGQNITPTLIRSKNYIPITPSKTYYGKWVYRVFYYGANKNYLGYATLADSNGAGVTFTPLSTASYMRFNVVSEYGATYNHNICINISDATINGNYYPYEEETLNIEADLNGVGTVSDEINVEEGKKYQRIGMVDLGTLNWSYQDINNFPTFTAFLSLAKPTSDNTKVSNLLTSNYTTVSPNSNYTGGDKVVSLAGIGSNSIWLKDSNYTDATTFKTAMSGVYLIYELATPIVADIEIENDGWLSNLIKDGSITQQVDTTDTSALIAKEVDIAVNVVVDNQ